ncbi:MAG: class I SAM-dependent methyltransferase [Anaerobutyricum sp.]
MQKSLAGKIATCLGNGLAPLEPGETDTVVIAGMGGDLICKILKAKPEFLIEGKELILQPQSEWFKVRQILKEYRYQIEKEWFLKEDGKYYVIIKAEPGWTQPQATEAQAAFYSRIYERNSRYTGESDCCEGRNGRDLRTVWQILNRNEKFSLN